MLSYLNLDMLTEPLRYSKEETKTCLPKNVSGPMSMGPTNKNVFNTYQEINYKYGKQTVWIFIIFCYLAKTFLSKIIKPNLQKNMCRIAEWIIWARKYEKRTLGKKEEKEENKKDNWNCCPVIVYCIFSSWILDF